MSVQILPIKCPHCGNSTNVIEKEFRFGLQFLCKYCQTTSVVIINHQLMQLDKLVERGELVCTKCGRVISREARYCQCGSPTVQTCINCFKEFPVDHQICDFCGWPQDISISSEKGVNLSVQRAVRDLRNPDPEIVIAALDSLSHLGKAASPALHDALDIIGEIVSGKRKSPSPTFRAGVIKLLEVNNIITMDEAQRLQNPTRYGIYDKAWDKYVDKIVARIGQYKA